jgi:hypothetical protein
LAGRVVGRKPQPRALIQGFDDEVADRLMGLFPTVRRIEWLEEVAQEEWDVLITDKTVHGAAPHLWVVAFGGAFKAWHKNIPATLGQCQFPAREPEEAPHVRWSNRVKASEFTVPDGLPGALERLVDTTLVPAAREHDDHWTLQPDDMPSMLEWQEILTPFLLVRRSCIAGKFRRVGGLTECWCLPDYMEETAPQWVEAALGEWYKHDPHVFPSAAWRDSRRWRTSDENRLADQLEELRGKRAEVLAVMAVTEEALLAKFGEAKHAAEGRERVLVDGAGERLEAVIADCFADLGFDVKEMNQVYPQGDRREDLQVRDPDTPGWTALVGVRGYTTGAKVNDLLRFGRYRIRYVREHGEDVGAVWYVVNQFNEDDPEIRPPVLASNETELETFAADGGLVIDTADLFQMWRAVQDGSMTAAEARATLIKATGRFVFMDRHGGGNEVCVPERLELWNGHARR